MCYLAQDKTGSLDGDVRKLSKLIDKYVSLHASRSAPVADQDAYKCSLVVELGLRSTLSEYKVPREDLPKIAELAVGSTDDPTYPRVVQLLESIY